MNRRELTESLLFAGLRLLAVGLLLAGALGLAFELGDAWYRFDPNYLGDFLMATVYRPTLVLGAGIILFFLARRLARACASPLP
jgi:hypothetical protein